MEGPKPRPSMLGDCKRKAVYYLKDVPREINTASQIKALKGQAFHLMALEFFEYCTKTQPEFKGLQSYQVNGNELKVQCDWGSIKGEGTLDLWVTLLWDNDIMEDAVIDFKFYGNVPKVPYEGNLMQVRAYAEAVGAHCTYLIYIDDRQKIGVFRNAATSVSPECEAYWQEVQSHLSSDTLPPRLPYGSIKCSMCSYNNHCWSDILELMFDPEERKKQRHEIDANLQEKIRQLADIRERLNAEKKVQDDLRGEIVTAMVEGKKNDVTFNLDGSDYKVTVNKSKEGIINLNITRSSKHE